MRRLILLALACAIGAVSACSRPAGTLDAATESLGAATLQSIEYSGTGRWFQFGQAPGPTLPWPQFDVSSFSATVNYQTPGARVQMTRRQTIEPGRTRPAPVEQRPVQLVSGTYAWNLAPPAGAPPTAAPEPQPQPAAVEERVMEIWTTPHGFSKDGKTNGPSGNELGRAVNEAGSSGGSLNPTWVEWLMGWPLGWTDYAPLATDRFRLWSASHGRR